MANGRDGNGKHALVEVRALVHKLQAARALLAAVVAQWKRNGRLTAALVHDVERFLAARGAR